jgi:GNAT superfamily N-acetyltransferase
MIKPVSYAVLMGAPNFDDLIDEYGSECSIPQIGRVAPQAAIYAQMEQTGMLQTFGVYLGELLIGFASVLVFIVPHYGKQIANVESLFLTESQRNAETGRELMDVIENYARQKGCVVILYNARHESRFERLLIASRNRYQRTNSVFCRSL